MWTNLQEMVLILTQIDIRIWVLKRASMRTVIGKYSGSGWWFILIVAQLLFGKGLWSSLMSTAASRQLKERCKSWYVLLSGVVLKVLIDALIQLVLVA